MGQPMTLQLSTTLLQTVLVVAKVATALLQSLLLSTFHPANTLSRLQSSSITTRNSLVTLSMSLLSSPFHLLKELQWSTPIHIFLEEMGHSGTPTRITSIVKCETSLWIFRRCLKKQVLEFIGKLRRPPACKISSSICVPRALQTSSRAFLWIMALADL